MCTGAIRLAVTYLLEYAGLGGYNPLVGLQLWLAGLPLGVTILVVILTLFVFLCVA